VIETSGMNPLLPLGILFPAGPEHNLRATVNPRYPPRAGTKPPAGGADFALIPLL